MSSEHSSLLRNTQETAPAATERPWWVKYAVAGAVVAVVGGAAVYVATSHGQPAAVATAKQGGAAATTTAAPATTPAPTTTAVPSTTASGKIVFPDSTLAPNTTEFAAFFKDFYSKMDATADPCVDFYQYACGGWMNATTLGETDVNIDSAIWVVVQENDKITKTIMASKPPLLEAFLEACLNETDVNAAAVVDVSTQLHHIAGIQTVDELLAYAGSLQTSAAAVPSFLDVGVSVDPKNSDTNVLMLSQGGLTLPSAEYYAPEKVASIVPSFEAYVTTLAKVEALQGVDVASLLSFETKLANVSLPQAQLRDPWATYHKVNLTDVAATYPLVGSYLRGAQPSLFAQSQAVLVTTPSFFAAQDALLKATDLAVLKAYLSFHLVHARSSVLGESFRQANDYFQGLLRGRPGKTSRAKFCMQTTQTQLGEYLGQLFMDKVFDATEKRHAQDLIQQIEDSMTILLNNLTWLDDSTRRVGLEKVTRIRNFIGGPDAVTPLPFNLTTSFYANMNQFSEWATTKTWASLHTPVDQTAWGMFAYTVNAYNDPTANKIVFPAAILQPPFYSATSYPPVVNYARIGMVMGHELTHGFDDAGRNFDPKGQLKAWWTDGVKATFDKNAKCLADQYSTFPIRSIDGKTTLGHVNGQLTLGENIADNGGLKLAYMAYQRVKAANASLANIGYDDAKLYFTAYAQGQCQKMTDGTAVLRMNTDPHSPNKYRALGPLYNSQAFADAFQCPVGSPMNPVKKCVVW
ncbi:Aste57867_1572 [Aphanomyces stellatus]|uniref:Aste57867_1572 protein n=1 Tax=Aphanomyces stellatus TaxID=120398 RepID=A0A485K8Z5_9STRA|nr:hypothetical protein As57867_001571 [Aphanomyces stellatus]VFT78785.1 Aste57867_1572 [Aphanomyces stellatus]